VAEPLSHFDFCNNATHYHEERNHQGKGNVLIFPSAKPSSSRAGDDIGCNHRLGGMLKYYHREAA
jgi:putative transposase